MKKITIIIISISSLLLVAALGYLIYTRTRSQRIDKANPIDGFNKFWRNYKVGDLVPVPELYNEIILEQIKILGNKKMSTSDPHIRGKIWNNSGHLALSYG